MELAEQIMEYVKLDDRASHFKLHASENVPSRASEVLEITGPIKDGKLVWKVAYLIYNHHDNCWQWESLTYAANNWGAVATFAEGFLWNRARTKRPNRVELSRIIDTDRDKLLLVSHWELCRDDRVPWKQAIADALMIFKTET